jgi:hypothetical protein
MTQENVPYGGKLKQRSDESSMPNILPHYNQLCNIPKDKKTFQYPKESD